MQANIESDGQSPEPPARPRRVVLLGIANPTINRSWIPAARACDAECVIESQADGGALRTIDSIATVLVVSDSSFAPVMASRTDETFRRIASIVVTERQEQIALWRWIAWDAVWSGASPEGLVAVLQEALNESAERVAEWERFEEVQRRQATLNKTERKIYESVCRGRLNKQIARDLEVSIRTVEQWRRSLFDKMGVTSAVPLAALTASAETLASHVRRERQREARFETPPSASGSPSHDPRVSAPNFLRDPKKARPPRVDRDEPGPSEKR